MGLGPSTIFSASGPKIPCAVHARLTLRADDSTEVPYSGSLVALRLEFVGPQFCRPPTADARMPTHNIPVHPAYVTVSCGILRYASSCTSTWVTNTSCNASSQLQPFIHACTGTHAVQQQRCQVQGLNICHVAPTRPPKAAGAHSDA